jgi:hypothetical protein
MEAWVQTKASPCGICDGQGGTGTRFLSGTFLFPSVSVQKSQQFTASLNNTLKYKATIPFHTSGRYLALLNQTDIAGAIFSTLMLTS